jgi:hypothetical protein
MAARLPAFLRGSGTLDHTSGAFGRRTFFGRVDAGRGH